MLFRARQFEIRFPRPTIVVGIVNVTPDSFSDGGKFLDRGAAVAHALELVAQGAEILDIGGESTRPGAQPVDEKEELRRVIPVIEELAAKTGVALSIDTTKPGVARAALVAGASIVNDIAGGREDAGIWRCVAEFSAGYIAMHALGQPHAMPATPAYDEVVREVGEFFARRLDQLAAAGVSPSQVVLDPGIGFGKAPRHNLQLLANLDEFSGCGRPLLVGVSRKSFIGKISGANLNERLPASLACATLAVESGVQFIRAHDVKETIQAVRMAEAILSQKNDVA